MRTNAARRDQVFRRLLALADILAASISIVIAGALLAADLVNLASLIGLPLIVFAAKTVGLYDRDELVIHKTTLNDAPKLFYVTTLFTLVYTVVQADLQETMIATQTIVVLWALMMSTMMVGRWGARWVARTVTPPERCVLVGDTTHARRVKRLLESHPTLSAELVAVIPFQRVTARGEDAHEFGEYLKRSDFHRVIVTHTDEAHDMIDTIRIFKSRGVKVSVLPSLFDVLGSAVEFDDLGGATLLGVRRYGLTRSSEYMKRGLDILVAAAALVALAPLFAAIAVLIKRSSPGPVFFRQTRVGMGDTRFQIVKFRTMRDDAEERKVELLDRNETRGLFKIADDPRVTGIGGVLRRASLDELPQLLNVLRGEMSLVGPRPLVVDEDEQVAGWHRGRLDLTPGMTGAWQILGNRVPLEDMVSLDYLYIVNWSLWSDIQILLRTVPHVLGRRNR
ncbi:MAG TPA: exopolysaccharide biosynthesis polyprenyl glycosylphosphotransferase [Thermoleophilaceae bacterium]|nr:exopolysaccharide biosynthesis polyprenyl glycosylphosphotransferase [Thermoleophilaceae bacterium]